MPRIDIKDLDQKTMDKLDQQRKKYGIKSRSDYIRLLINLDILTDLVKLIRNM